jgi:hypothetical protein
MPIFTDNFNRADSSSGLGANWTHHSSTGAGITSNQFKVQNTFAGISRWVTEASAADHYSELKVINTGAATLGPAVRMPVLASSNSSTGDYYMLVTNSTNTQVLIRRKDNLATSLTTLGAAVSHTVNSGDLLRLTASGTNLIGYVNGTEVIRRDTSLAPLTAGGQGVGFYASGVTDIVADDWGGGDLTTARSAQQYTDVLRTPTSADRRSAQQYADVLRKPLSPDRRAAQQYVDVLYNLVPSGPTISWWDGAALQTATVLGWWDGTAIQPVTSLGWWDGSAIQPLG